MALVALCCSVVALAQPALPRDDYRYRADWITHPAAAPEAFGVYLFEREVELPERPTELWARISGDNRYRLTINGTLVSEGPHPGDVQHWRYARIDLAPYLRPGRNVLSAQVWNYGARRPVAMMSFATGFLLEVEGPDEHRLRTGGAWTARRDLRYGIHDNPAFAKTTYVVVAPGERIDPAAGYGPVVPALVAGQANGYGQGTDGGHKLVWDGMGGSREGYGTPREPQAVDPSAFTSEQTLIHTTLVRIDDDEPTGGLSDIVIPPHTRRRLLYAAPRITNGYLEGLGLRNAAGVPVLVTYAEALIDDRGVKGHRDSLRGKHILGIRDSVVCADDQLCRIAPLNWRTWRYVELDLTTRDSAVTVMGHLVHREVHHFDTFHSRIRSESSPSIQQIHRVGLNTAEACLAETFMDCPYYERLQYVGDTRIQALIRLYASTDDRPVLRAIRDFDQSRLPEGLTQSRYPSWRTQVIPPFSLFWIAMIGDYYRIRGDTALVLEMLPGIGQVLDWHERQLRPDGLLGQTPHWNFVDWTKEWPWDESVRVGGVPPVGPEGGSVLLTLQYAYALRQAAELLDGLSPTLAAEYRERHARVLTAVAKTYDGVRGLYPDALGVDSYAQHTQIMAALAGVYDGDTAAGRELMQRVLADASLIQTTYYYRFYLFEALDRMGMADRYLDLLGPWQTMLDLGLTTFAEKPEPTRSDCHAWSASPSYHLLKIVGGVDVREGGRTVDFAPQLGDLRDLTLSVPHPGGTIEAEYAVSPRGALTAKLVLPKGTTGTLHWRGRTKTLAPGPQTVRVE